MLELAGLFIVALVLLVVILWVWALLDILRKPWTTSETVLFIILIFMFPVVGSLVYFFLRNRGQNRNIRQQ